MNSDVKQRRVLHGRGLTSLLTAASFLIMTVTGVVLYMTPRGRVAHWIDWRFLCLDKNQWAFVHITSSLLFVIVVAIHLVFNWRAFWRYLAGKVAAGRRLWKEMLLTGAISAAVVLGTLCGSPPFQQIVELSNDIKARWDKTRWDSPYAHAEESPLWEFAERIGLSREQLFATLQKEGFPVSGMDVTVGELAREKGVSAAELFQAIRKHHPEVDKRRRGGGGRGRHLRENDNREGGGN